MPSRKVCGSVTAFLDHAEGQLFALLGRNVERAENPIPDRQAIAEVLVEVSRIGGVVHLMMRGAEEDPPDHAAERDPQMRVLQMHIGVDEDHQQQVLVGDRELVNGFAERVAHRRRWRRPC